MTTIVVSSALANKPGNGGNAWAVLNWILGLRKLGFDVYFVEEIAEAGCVDASGAQTDIADSINLAFFRQVTSDYGLAQRSALICLGGTRAFGMEFADVVSVVQHSELLVNISGHLTNPELRHRVRRAAYIDFDPGYTQFWYEAGGFQENLAGHAFYFTVGENIGSAGCTIPMAGIPWQPVRQPIVLDSCRIGDGPGECFTTVASWRGAYGPVYTAERQYGLKVHEFRKLADIPRRTGQTFEIALDIHPADYKDVELLSAAGWRIVSPATVGSPQAFDSYIRASRAEFSAAQGIYVETRSGWFSDRTARYLACGRPALVQDTGFSRNIPAGKGLLAFQTPDDAAEGIALINADYESHCLAARALAEEYFDSDKVLGGFCRVMGIHA